MSKPINHMTSAEFRQFMKTDPKIQAVRATADADRAVRSAERRAAERPLTEALQAAGYNVDSVWTLKSKYSEYDSALPILVEHLNRDYPDRVREGIARALSVRKAKKWWPELKRHYIEATLPDAQDGLAQALMRTVTAKTADELIPLIQDESNGKSRVLLVSSLKKSRNPATRQFLEDLRADPSLSLEAKRVVDGTRY